MKPPIKPHNPNRAPTPIAFVAIKPQIEPRTGKRFFDVWIQRDPAQPIEWLVIPPHMRPQVEALANRHGITPIYL